MDPVSNAKSIKRPTADRRTRTALAVLAALGLGVGYAYTVPAAAGAPTQALVAKSTAVSTATQVCPIISGAAQAEVEGFTPVLGDGGPQGTAQVTQMGTATPLGSVKTPGLYVGAQSLSGAVTNLAEDSLPVTGQATGDMAPGFTLDATLDSGATGTDSYGLASAACIQPDTNFWFIGAGTDANPVAQLNLVDIDSLTSQVNLTEYDSTGQLNGAAQAANQGLVVQNGSQLNPPGQLTNTAGTPDAFALNVVATTGRVAAALLSGDGKGGGRDFVAAEQPATSLVIPGVPAFATGTTGKLELMLMATSQDADVTLKWIGKSTFTPSVTVPHLAAGHVQSVDISGIPAPGEAGALEIDSNGGPIIGVIKVLETAGGSSDTAYLTPVSALTGDSVVAVDVAGSTVELTNKSAQAAQVRVTTSGPTATGTAATPIQKTVTVPANSTLDVPLAAPTAGNEFAVTVTPLDGASQIYAARVMTGDAPLITIQPMFTASESVLIPPVRADLSGTVPQN